MNVFNRTLIFLLLLVSFATRASHMAGGDIEIKSLGKDSFKITLRIYRDCNGVQINSSPNVHIYPVGAPSSLARDITLSRTLVRPVSFTCKSQKSVCEGGSFPFGIEENRFEGIVRVNNLWTGGLDSNYCWLNFSYSECCRNSDITNVSPANFFTEAGLDRCVFPYNSTPQILNEPIAVICAGQPYRFNNGFADSDSLSFELTEPLVGPNAPDSFYPGYSKLVPLYFLGFPNAQLPFPAGFYLSPTTGDLNFTPIGVQKPVLAIKVTEWRKINGIYRSIGYTRRDAQFFVYNCPPNTQPEVEINGSKNGPFMFTACAGEPKCIYIRSSDKDTAASKPDSTRLDWNKGIPEATFSNVNTNAYLIQHDTATFCWTPGTHQISSLPYYFTIKATDNSCPVAGLSIQSVGIMVKGISSYKIEPLYLNYLSYRLRLQQINQNGLTATATEWAICKGNVFNSANSTVLSGDSVNYTFDSIGTYVIRAKLTAQNCTRYIFDTLEVNGGSNSVSKFDWATMYAVYPNPAKESFTIELTREGQYQFILTDYTGRMVKQVQFEGNSTSVNTKGLTKGMYLITILSSQNETIRSKVVVE